MGEVTFQWEDPQELAKELKKHQYHDGTLHDLANLDLYIKHYNRNIYGDYKADVAAVYSQYIYLANKEVA